MGYLDVERKKMPPRLQKYGEFSMLEINSAYLRKNLCEWNRDSGKNLLIGEVGKVGKTV